MSTWQLYFYSPEGLAMVQCPGAQVSGLLCAANLALAQYDEERVAFYAFDVQGSVLAYTRRELSSTAKYTAYGHNEESHGSVLRFTAQRKDVLTGNYMLGEGYRAFNSSLMRFHSPDYLSPFDMGGINTYCYCNGDPINKIDPSGHVSGNVPIKPKSILKKTTSINELAAQSQGVEDLELRKINFGAELDHLGRNTGKLVQEVVAMGRGRKEHYLAVEGSLLSTVRDFGGFQANYNEIQLATKEIPGFGEFVSRKLVMANALTQALDLLHQTMKLHTKPTPQKKRVWFVEGERNTVRRNSV